MKKSLEQRIAEAVREEVSLAAYDPAWPAMFADEARSLRSKLPGPPVGRIEHFGSTAVPGLCAKPVIDILVEVASHEQAKETIAPALEAEGYEYFWRPMFEGSDVFYAWFIKRGPGGKRTHHIHMVESDSELWDRLRFRDYLREFPAERERYERLKRELAARHPGDRVAYTEAKTGFVVAVTEKAKRYYDAA
ncbi:MAG: GrpB family protein [Elusimicrobiota bacterium]